MPDSDEDYLQQLADHIREHLPGTRGPGGHWTDATMALYAQLTHAVEAEGYPRRVAALAVTRWIVTGEPIRVCVDRCLADWIERLRRRGDDQQLGPPETRREELTCRRSPT